MDGNIEKNTESRRWKSWVWHATPGQMFSGEKREKKIFSKQLPKGIHYIELWADKTPVLHTVTLDLGDYISKRIPTVEDPKWTEDFTDDTDQIILARALFGEVRNTLVPDKARIAIGWVIKNRMKSKGRGYSYYEIITEPSQFSAFNKTDPNRPFVENPLHTGNGADMKAWKHAYDIAGKIIKATFQDPTQRANHYYDDSISTPDWAQDKKPTLHITYINESGSESTIYFYNL
ncbi:hypothetical protein COU88_01250 [Candidatus Roizmanbacteria bacterium CG10_big_fil_rev_8_21_14_0_10_39_6]|uniref:Cell wall hydrolase SleB domain-containing protein n=1 Tax=Candidatus Roizmanbacteria bacterium CG10_big_fil_rev_8_21_14_0_10_39_6 TaxID=1974853 RepID=A0A2M8KT86_9BACT|nr:MAG: hypothetical protein COU88_01250 [Candidatus Roizmanbacteria bacterium CG10_big_fil_rev_8_21_14_0_10_39_6]